ncbi:MAG: BlaI/MecI/CopY family transcriptional regulator [Pseudomonadota bacterium]
MALSDFELAVLQLFWDQGDLSAPRAHELVSETRAVTYSTVKTIIDRLEKKGALRRVEQHGRTIIYAAALDREAVQRPLVREFVSRVFGGDRSPLFSYLMDQDSLSEKEIETIKALTARLEDKS